MDNIRKEMIDVIMESIRNIDLINALEDKVRLLFRHKLEKVFKEEIAQARQQDPDQLMAYYIMGLETGLKLVNRVYHGTEDGKQD